MLSVPEIARPSHSEDDLRIRFAKQADPAAPLEAMDKTWHLVCPARGPQERHQLTKWLEEDLDSPLLGKKIRGVDMAHLAWRFTQHNFTPEWKVLTGSERLPLEYRRADNALIRNAVAASCNIQPGEALRVMQGAYKYMRDFKTNQVPPGALHRIHFRAIS